MSLIALLASVNSLAQSAAGTQRFEPGRELPAGREHRLVGLGEVLADPAVQAQPSLLLVVHQLGGAKSPFLAGPILFGGYRAEHRPEHPLVALAGAEGGRQLALEPPVLRPRGVLGGGRRSDPGMDDQRIAQPQLGAFGLADVVHRLDDRVRSTAHQPAGTAEETEQFR
jgi:hypothetical protein